jgi:large subunit ribosomal protein L3
MSIAHGLGLVGRKRGMTRVFTDAGETVPVTVIEALPNRVAQVKTPDNDGYKAVQVAYGTRRASRISKGVAGHYAKANVAAGEKLVEFRLGDKDGDGLTTGSELKVDMFQAGQVVDVTGTTMGKGFAGVMKRHNFAGGLASHGWSVSHRTPGSIGQRQTPGRVFQGKRMSGHMGVQRRTIENLRVVQVDACRAPRAAWSSYGRRSRRPHRPAVSGSRRSRRPPRPRPRRRSKGPAP